MIHNYDNTKKNCYEIINIYIKKLVSGLKEHKQQKLMSKTHLI